jgi:fucose permease
MSRRYRLGLETLWQDSDLFAAQGPPFGVFCATFFLAALGTAFQDSQANTFVSTVKTAHRWLGVVHASYGFGCLIGPLIATAIASARPEKWTCFYWLLVGLGVTNLVFVAWTFRGDWTLGRTTKEESGTVRHKGKAQKAWEESKATLKEKVVWLLSLFFFFHLGVGITAGGKYARRCLSRYVLGLPVEHLPL